MRNKRKVLLAQASCAMFMFIYSMQHAPFSILSKHQHFANFVRLVRSPVEYEAIFNGHFLVLIYTLDISFLIQANDSPI